MQNPHEVLISEKDRQLIEKTLQTMQPRFTPLQIESIRLLLHEAVIKLSTAKHIVLAQTTGALVSTAITYFLSGPELSSVALFSCISYYCAYIGYYLLKYDHEHSGTMSIGISGAGLNLTSLINPVENWCRRDLASETAFQNIITAITKENQFIQELIDNSKITQYFTLGGVILGNFISKYYDFDQYNCGLIYSSATTLFFAHQAYNKGADLLENMNKFLEPKK